MENKKTFAVKNKKIALSLSQQGFELLNVTKNKYDGSPCFIFEDTDKFRAAFELKLKKDEVDLTKKEKKYVLELLKCRQCEFKSLDLDTKVIDGIIDKLDTLQILDCCVSDNKPSGEIKLAAKSDNKAYQFLKDHNLDIDPMSMLNLKLPNIEMPNIKIPSDFRK